MPTEVIRSLPVIYSNVQLLEISETEDPMLNVGDEFILLYFTTDIDQVQVPLSLPRKQGEQLFQDLNQIYGGNYNQETF